jgi:hypothetical protein
MVRISGLQGLSVNTDELIKYLIDEGYKWIMDQRNLHFPTAQELTEPDRKSLEPYFEPEILISARIRLVELIENPQFYLEILKLSIPNLVDFRQMAGITFVDCILISRKFTYDQQAWTSLLFHEMVHVAQYRLLGTKRFAELYVIGWAQNGFEYERIPLERQAYNLQREFDEGKGPFAVAGLLKQEFGRII